MRYLILVAMIFALSGCTALVVGGAATAAYQLGKDEREPEVIASDSAITTKIKSKYAVDSVVSVFGIGVRTYEGKVTLSGTVSSDVARNVAVTLARDTGGVKSVANQIVVKK
ncbi:MAG: BON domain-containing protein [Gammaproteobacteria bacterium]|nr:BON domain-containing protein [Gammaproteobacteria bacterium]MDH3468569.1 BON domain-containing protein [Gammaproteobacteria bacterium]